MAYLFNPIMSSTERTVVEITGNALTPPPCITLSTDHPYDNPNAKSLLICGKSEKLAYHANEIKLDAVKVDLGAKHSLSGTHHTTKYRTIIS